MTFAGRGILPPQGMEPAGSIEMATFVQILGADLGQRAPRAAARPLRGFLLLAVLIFLVVACG